MADDGQYDSQINLEQEEYEQETTIEQEDSELEITMQPEAATVYGGSVVNSVNGQVGDVILTTSDLENTSDYQTGAQVQSAIAGKQDKLTAGNNITINNNIISATDTTYTAGSGLDLDGTTFSVDTNTIATVQDVTNEAITRENADINLQGQIDALTVSSDVIDVLGTYQDLQNYDTTHVKANDIIKVLQDSTHTNAMSYYRWVVTDHVGAWVYVGSEGPYYTKSEADTLLNNKQNTEDNSLNTTHKTIVGAINEVDGIAKGANQALSFVNYSTMVTEFNSLAGDEYNVGQNIMVVTLEVPDLWISGIESTSSTYTYTTDEAFTTAMATNGYVQVGYYKLSALETQKVDLTNYVTNTDYATNAVGGVVKTNINYGTSVDSNGSLRGTTKTYEDYGSMHNLGLISKVTLENVIAGKGLVSNTDYATTSSAGLVKTSSGAATDTVTSNGTLYARNLDYTTYGSASDNAFIGKGTLENVITGKGLVDQTALAGKQDTLTAGTGIDITNNVISATGETTYYGVSNTNGTVQAKTVTVDNGFTLHDGAAVRVLFANGQTYSGAPTLNVNSTGAKTIQYKSGTNAMKYIWTSGQVVDFVYRQTSDVWIMVMGGLASTSYYGITKLASSTTSTTTSTALTPYSLNAVMANIITGYPTYSSSSTYAVGDRVRNDWYVYECTTAITTAESWDASHWKTVDPLQTQIDALAARISALENR